MLEERLKQIAHTILQETYSKPSRVSEEKSQDSTAKREKENTENHCFEEERELRTPCSSMGESSAGSHGYTTPPYLSPGATRRIQWREDFFLWKREVSLKPTKKFQDL